MLPRSKSCPRGVRFSGTPGIVFTSTLVEVRLERRNGVLRGSDSLRRASDSIVGIAPLLPGPGPVHLSARSGTSRDSDRKSPADVEAGCAREFVWIKVKLDGPAQVGERTIQREIDQIFGIRSVLQESELTILSAFMDMAILRQFSRGLPRAIPQVPTLRKHRAIRHFPRK